MRFTVQQEQRQLQGKEQTVYLLSSPTMRAELWPGVGFNCLRWQIHWADAWHDLLYVAPDFAENPVPTRSGIPILFPFPNRIRDGKFRFNGRLFELPCNDSTKKNAIHGFVCRHPWRVLRARAKSDEASVQAIFQLSENAPPEVQALWPCDFRLIVTYRLSDAGLSVEALVENPTRTPLPFGLGYHPYFRLPGMAAEPNAIGPLRLQTCARQYWELIDNLPTGGLLPVSGERDLRRGRVIGTTTLDDIWTDLPNPSAPAAAAGLIERAQLVSPTNHRLAVWTSRAFRELVLFTPPHRNAVAIEPYTCVTDAINLFYRGIDSGWQELLPSHSWRGTVEFRLTQPT